MVKKNGNNPSIENSIESLYKIIVIEGDKDLNASIRKRLNQEGFQVDWALTGEEALSKISGEPTELLLIDHDLPDMKVKQFIEKLIAAYQKPPHFITMTGVGDEKSAVEMMKLGARDNIIKESSFIEFLVVKLVRIVEEIEKSEENERYRKLHLETEHLAGVGGWLWHVNSDRWIMSDNWMVIHGCSRKYFTTDDLLKLAHPEDSKKIEEAFSKTVTKGEPYQIEHRIIRQDNGQTGYVRSFGKAELDHDGNVRLVSGAAMDITERRKVKEALQESEEKYRSIFENAALGIFRSRPEGKYEIVNQAFASILGFDSPEKMLHEVNDISKLYKHPEDRKNIIKEFAEKGFVEDYVVAANHKVKDIVWISITALQMQYPDGSIYFEGTIQDITDRKIAEEKLEESREETRRIVENSIDGIMLTAPDGSIYSANPAACKMFGRTEKEICEVGREGLVDFSDPRAAEFIKIRNEKGKVNIELTSLRKDGSRFPAEVSSALFKDKDGNVKTSMIVRDISERKKAESELKINEKRLSQNLQHLEKLNNSLVDIVLTTTPATREIKYVNQAVEKIFGYSQEEFIHKNTAFIYASKKDYIEFGKKLKKAISKNKDSIKTELRLKRKNGQVFTAEINTSFIKEKKEIVNVLNIIRDVSEKIKYQNELIAAKEKAEESDRLKSAFLANMSHELRTPMNGVLGFTSLLQKRKLSDEEQKKYIEIIHQSGIRMLNTVNDIIDISRIESGIIEVSTSEVNITEQLKYYYSFFKPEAANKGIDFILNINSTAKDIIIHTDLEKFNSILTNLIKNAIKYTNKGVIEFGCTGKRKKSTDGVEFYVKDTGIGIPGNRHEAVFERFIQADIEDKDAIQGSGLGLAISKAFVEMLGGKIWLDSKEDVGSTFYFTIQNLTS